MTNYLPMLQVWMRLNNEMIKKCLPATGGLGVLRRERPAPVIGGICNAVAKRRCIYNSPKLIFE